MSNVDIDKFYVSPYDKFMRKFDKEHDLSASQVKEIEKHKKIAQLRDNVIKDDNKDKIWADF